MIGCEKLTKCEPNRRQTSESGRADEHVHDDDLQLHRFQRRSAGQNHAGHRAGKLNEAHRFGAVHDGGHAAVQGGAQIGMGGLTAGGAQGQCGFDLSGTAVYLIPHPPHHQRTNIHRIANHHPGDGDDLLGGKVENTQRHQQPQRQCRAKTDRRQRHPPGMGHALPRLPAVYPAMLVITAKMSRIAAGLLASKMKFSA